MNQNEILACVDEVEAILSDPSLVEKNGLTLDQLLNINVLKMMVLCFYHFRLFPVDKEILTKCLDATQDDEYDIIYDAVYDKWRNAAENEIAQLMHEIESEPIC